jgi:hypothetical protein
MEYLITSTDEDRWEPINATTALGAKRACTTRFGAGNMNATLMVGILDAIGAPMIVFTKKNYPGAIWESKY